MSGSSRPRSLPRKSGLGRRIQTRTKYQKTKRSMLESNPEKLQMEEEKLCLPKRKTPQRMETATSMPPLSNAEEWRRNLMEEEKRKRKRRRRRIRIPSAEKKRTAGSLSQKWKGKWRILFLPLLSEAATKMAKLCFLLFLRFQAAAAIKME